MDQERMRPMVNFIQLGSLFLILLPFFSNSWLDERKVTG